ncbi:MAG: diacylglycerol kinase family lipid kinase [Mycobacteriaceae bacterium]|nr:diacylglycerol kinase family lipid kinase [Mycobacteriaceae bacterium]
MRAVLIVNPAATSTTAAGRDLLASALKSRVQLTVSHTHHREHATELGRAATREGVDLVVVHGGDGTVSAVVNGLLGHPRQPSPEPIPAVAIVPGGSANALARTLGISPDPTAATNQLVRLIDNYQHQHTWRRIGLIDCGEQWAVLNAGMGVDAEVVAAVEAQRRKGIKVTPTRYWREAIPITLAYSRRKPTLTLHLPDQDPICGVHFAWVSNTNPWTYSNNRPLWTNPGCTFESGLGVFAVTSMKTIPTLRLLRQMISSRPKLRAKQLIRDDNVAYLRITCTGQPIASQFDGDYLGLRETMTFRAVPNALAVVAPRPKNHPELG